MRNILSEPLKGVSFMPERKPGEPLNKFLGRFLSSKREKRKFPDLKQREAVGYAEAKRADKRP